MSKLPDPEYWCNLVPELTISDQGNDQAFLGFPPDVLAGISVRFHEEGYLRLPPVFAEDDLDPIRNGILALAGAGYPPVFIYLFDQPYHLFARLRALIGYFLGDRYALLPNFWAWNIPATAGAHGWPPHQDCQATTRFSDGNGGNLLISLSLWVPLSDATLDNGCMSVLPRAGEKYYDLPLEDPGSIDPVHGLALPVAAGSVLGWPQDLYHWSNQVTEKAHGPRISLSLEFQNRAFDPLTEPLLDADRPPSFDDRLRLVCQQFSKYQHMEDTGFTTTRINEIHAGLRL